MKAYVCEPAALTLCVDRKGGRFGGGGDSSFEPPSANTCTPGTTPPFDDVGVPPTAIAMYCLPSTE